MDLTVSLDDETLIRAQRSAQLLGKTLDELISQYLETLGRNADVVADTVEFRRLSLEARGQSRGWKFNREEIHRR